MVEQVAEHPPPVRDWAGVNVVRGRSTPSYALTFELNLTAGAAAQLWALADAKDAARATISRRVLDLNEHVALLVLAALADEHERYVHGTSWDVLAAVRDECGP